jgi:hypothetical protein
LIGGGLQHVSGRTGFEGLEEVLLVVIHGQHEYVGVGGAAGDFPGSLQARHPWHRYVEDGQVDVFAAGQGDGFGAVAGFGDYPKPWAVLEDQPDPAAHQRMVVGQQDADLAVHMTAFVRGMRSTTSVPRAPLGPR